MPANKSEALFWSERGEVACAKHAPYRGSDTWVWERWESMSVGARREWERESGKPAACEVCEGMKRRAERSAS